ncbi:carboxymuconolactone decarboxylase family protein [Nocardioides sp.]|uniref:carboxymuconolactone decarboxylase family protein n=1 Tax=Nocardioides sp. TaxID=35761 RepID=UPI002716759C|nr:carboxymuconolactone decarboxylase family protein [Nocardioides sp.]MDO9457484.1 carboxymuconolactone decarboxylase family protein [Nocardioides sp.]
MSARVAPGRGPAVRAFAALAGRRVGTAPPAVFLTLGRHQRVFWPWLAFAGSLLSGGRLSRADTELVVLRVATLCGSDYELSQHRRIARAAGLTRDDVDRVADGPDAAGWTPTQRLLLRVVDALHADEDLDDATWAELVAAFDEPRALEVVLLAGHYRMLATALRTFRVEPDERR